MSTLFINTALEKLVRYCSRPPLSLSRLHEGDNGSIVYRLPDSEIYDQSYITLMPLELIHKIAEIIPPPNVHRHVYYGVLAPNSKLRKRVVLTAGSDDVISDIMENARNKMNLPPDDDKERALNKESIEKAFVPKKSVCSIWAIMIARIFEVMPLICTQCGSTMEIISFITERGLIEQILNHIGESSNPPHSTRSPPEDLCDRQSEYMN